MQTKDLVYHLQRHFNYRSFREGQQEIIEDVLRGEDVLGVLSTGSGKSLCYQLPAKLIPGITIVVSPLISLMIDQVRETKSFHFKEVVALHSFQERQERKDVLSNLQAYKLVYISPELLQQKEILQSLKAMQIALFVIDEAHCLSQWGYDFRPDYLRLVSVMDTLDSPPVLALTGTATEGIQDDIVHHLQRGNMKRHIYPAERHNIALIVEEVTGGESAKEERLISILENKVVPTIIYFSSRKMAEKISLLLRSRLLDRCISYYHGGMETLDRLKIQQQFMNGQLDIICCTSAFGMGINKKDIRLVIHYHPPTQMESYIQEIGRAGRDEKQSVSLLLYRKGDLHIPQQIIENELPYEEEITYAMNQMHALYQAEKEIPSNETEIEQLFQMNITKWRFLYYQFEQHQMVQGNKVKYHYPDWKKSLMEINRFRNDRLSMKRNKLTEMINFIHTTSCLRQALYGNYQQTIHKVDGHCCNHCGFSLSDFEVLPHHNHRAIQTDWQTKLASLLLIGDSI